MDLQSNNRVLRLLNRMHCWGLFSWSFTNMHANDKG